MKKLSIIWADTDMKDLFPDYRFIQMLNIDRMLNFNFNYKVGAMKPSIAEFFTKDTSTMTYRCEMFMDLLKDRSLYLKLKESFSLLSQINDLRKEKETMQTNENLLHSIKELEFYVDYFESVRKLFTEHSVKSHVLLELKKAINRVCESDEYLRICNEVKRQSHAIKQVKSVTIGVNLNAQLHPIEAGVVKVNETSFVSGNFIDKMLKLDFSNDEFTCLAPLLSSSKEVTQEELAVLRHSLNTAFNKIFASSLKSWGHIIRKYVIENLDDFLGLLYEWRFVEICVDPLFRIQDAGYALCEPTIAENDKVIGLYNPMLVLMSENNTVVLNDLEFSADRIYILTGPNQGGKSVYTQAVGILYAMLHLGLPLPASRAIIHPVDAILTHFVDNREQNDQCGRFEGECQEIQQINRFITKNSLFLFDEALSSTSADEAVVVAKEILSAYSEIGAKGIWTTHLHGLCKIADEEQTGKSRICNLSAELSEDSHKRVYRIIKGAKYGKSYAMDVAHKYHLTRDEIVMMNNEMKDS